MSDDPRLGMIFHRWQEAVARGESQSPDELCRDCPELKPQVQECIEALQRVSRLMCAHLPGVLPSVTPSRQGLLTYIPDAPDSESSTDAALVVPGYEILCELGRGGMGVVYRALQVVLNREVALKMILAGTHAGQEERRRFLAEAEAVAAIEHPGIVRIYEFGVHNEHAYCTLEFCRGGSLAKKLAGKPLPPREAARVVEQVARGVQAAHEKGILHRDLKPGNILLDESGQPKVADFGLARKLDGGSGMTQTGAVVGTPSYMPPEQALGKKGIGPAADVYALGAILFECLTGRPPFLAATAYETLLQVVNEEPLSPRKLNAQVPADLETICLKCLRKEPAGRYHGAANLAEDLGRWLAGEPILARPARWTERTWKAVKRRPLVWASTVAAVVALLAGTAVSTYFGLSAREQAKLAEQREGEAIEKQQETQAALERAEETLAVGLLRPLGHRNDTINDYELIALEELAGLPREHDRARVLFIGKALERPRTAKQLDFQLEDALTAAVGLRRDLRESVLAIAASRLRDEKSSAEVRLVTAHILEVGRSQDSDLARRSMIVLLAEFAKICKDRHRPVLLGKAFPGRIEDPSLRRLAMASAQHITHITGEDAVDLAQQILALLPGAGLPRRLDEEVIGPPRIHPRELTISSGEEVLLLDQTFALLVPKLSTKTAKELAQQIVALSAKTTNDLHQKMLARALGVLAPKLPAKQASNEAEKLAKGDLTLKFPSRDTAELARQLLAIAGKMTQNVKLNSHEQAFAVFIPKLPPLEAAGLARQLLARAAGTTDPAELGLIARAFALLAPALPAEQAAKDAADLWRRVAAPAVKSVARFKSGKELEKLVEAFVALAPSLPDELTAKYAAELLPLFDLEEVLFPDSNDLLSFSRAFAVVAAKLPGEQAAKTSTELVGLVQKQAFKCLAWMSYDIQHPGLLINAPPEDDLPLLGQAFATLAPSLPSEQASKDAVELSRQIVGLATRTPSPTRLCRLAKTFTTLAATLPSEQATKDAAQLSQQVTALAAKTTGKEDLRQLSAAFAALAPKLAADQATKHALAISSRLGWTLRGSRLSDEDMKTLATLLPLLPDQSLLDVLKQPGVGEAGRAAVVAEFGKRLKREFRHQWDLAEHLERHRPDLDLASPLPPRKEFTP